jgi:Zn-dependent peptidase ImmA (M78 family)
MTDMVIKAPFLPYDRIACETEAFLAQYHPSRTIPVPVEDIIEKQLNIDIYPVRGLTRAFTANDDGVVAYVNSLLNLITVDHDAWEDHTTRYRFSITHELAHIILHRTIFSQLKVNSIAEWKLAMQSIPTDQYRWLETHANNFAGLLLVPTVELREQLNNYTTEALANGLRLDDESVRSYAGQYLSPIFGASGEVVRIRIEKENLWPTP